jgi:acetyltransferase
MSLDPIFAPRSIAVIGASSREGSVARAVVENLEGFGGPVYLVNPKRAEVCGRKAWPSVAAVGQPVDLAVVITPAETVPGVVAECVAAGVRGAIVISAGFREAGVAGAALERRVWDEARRGGLRLIGPNCLGVMVPGSGLNATFARQLGRPGRVAFLSQSGALATAILDLGLREQVGFSAFVSVGSMLDVGWGDLIRHFGADPETESIVMYVESVGDAASFLAAAREVAARKPIIVIKVGRTAEAARAAVSHTGAMTGRDAVFDAALRQVGVLRVDTIEELFDLAEILAKQPLPRGRRLGMVTNAGGPGALAVDALVGMGGEVAVLSDGTRAALDALLPAHWSHGNPVDVLGDAEASRFSAAVGLVAADPGVDGVLVVLTPQSMTRPTEVAERVVAVAAGLDKPLLCSWMGGGSVRDGRRVLNDAGVSTHDYPDAAARAFVHLWERRRRIEWLSESGAGGGPGISDLRPPAAARAVIDGVLAAGRPWLTERESKEVLAAWGIPVVATFSAASEDEAVARADALGYPVVVKLQSSTITHKSDVGGVQLNLGSGEAVRAAWRAMVAAVPPSDFGGVSVQRMVSPAGWELILGASVDPQFGPVLLFGAGGTLTEVMQDRALVLPPLTRSAARRWMQGTRIFRALTGVRGRPAVDLESLAGVLVRFGEMVVAHPEVEEIDINPLVASASGVVALDARFVVRAPSPGGGDAGAPGWPIPDDRTEAAG